MNVTVNGKPVQTDATTVAELQASLDLPKMVAIAVNNQVVPKAEWSNKTLQENDKVTIIKMACGG